MKRVFAIIFSTLAPALSFSQQSQNIRINEIMQSNIDCLLLEHDYPDSWIELYNPGNANIDIKGYSLQTGTGEVYKISSSAIINANGYLIIQCDKKNSGLHTNFKLESTNNGVIYLKNAAGIQVDSLVYEPMIAPNIAYGRKKDEQETVSWGWEITPTPQKDNIGGFSYILLPDPIFSINGRIMSSSENLTIKMPDGDLPEDALIYATVDGSEPTILAPYKGKELNFHISQSTNVKAKIISRFALNSLSVCHSYIFHPRNTNIPIISLTGNENDLYSKTEGFLWFMEEGEDNKKNNFCYNWHRPIYAEYLGCKGDSLGFKQLGEVAIAGGASRYLSGQPSLKLFANKRFGTKRFNKVFWEYDKPAISKTKSFMLRNGGNVQLAGRVNDAALQRIFGIHVPNLDYQAYSPILVYINGQYKGVYGLRERSNEDYVEANYNGLENIEITDQKAYFNSIERNKTSFKDVYSLYNNNNATYSDFEKILDIDNFMKAMIVEMFSINTDWPYNNISMWRPKDSNGKWRWIIKDLDMYAFANVNSFNMFKYLLGTKENGELPTSGAEYKTLQKLSDAEKSAFRIYQKLMSYPTFKEKFIDLFSTYLGDFLQKNNASSIAKDIREEIEEELEATSFVYGWNDYYDHDDIEIENSKNFWAKVLVRYIEARPAIVYNQMAKFFNLGAVKKTTVTTNGTKVLINNVELTQRNFDGAYFSQRNLNLSVDSNDAKWSMTTFNNGEIVENYIFDESNINILFDDYADCDSVAFSVLIEKSDFDLKLEDLSIDIRDCANLSNFSNIQIPEPSYAYANISGVEYLPTSKTDNLHAFIDFYDNAGNYMRKKILLNLQGNSEAEKSNISIQFCDDDWLGDVSPSITFGEWVAQDEFHLKGFYNDGLRGTAEVAYNVYSQISERTNCYPRAFPLSLYFNGNFYGIMAWQLKKHRDNMGLDKKTDTHIWLDGTINDKNLFQGIINWEKFEIRNPKDLYTMNGDLYDGDYPQEIIDNLSPLFDNTKGKMIRTANAKTHIIEFSNYCKELQLLKEAGATREEMRAEILRRFDVKELINYKIFSLITNNYDGFSKNWQWFTKDAQNWSVAPYDCNLTFGYNEEGASLWGAEKSSIKYDYKMEKTDSVGPMLWIKEYFWDDLKSRYAELRTRDIVSTHSIIKMVYDWYSRIGDNYLLEWNRWPNSPCVEFFNDNPARFEEWVTERIRLEDDYLGYSTDTIFYDLKLTDAKWATICVPFSFDIPENLRVYVVSGVSNDGVSLNLTEVFVTDPNKPYLVHGEDQTYHLSGEYVSFSEQEAENLANGLLIGSLKDRNVPSGSYVLQNTPSYGIGFYYVGNDNSIVLPANHAYLWTDLECKLGHFRVADETESIIAIECCDENSSNVYNFWGQKTDSKKSGFQIRRLPDGSFRKYIVVQ